jgi:hypothetical protein
MLRTTAISSLILMLSIVMHASGDLVFGVYDWEPKRKPISLTNGSLHSVTFSAESDVAYQIAIETPMELGFREQSCLLGTATLFRNECGAFGLPVRLAWRITAGDRVVESGVTDAWATGYSGEAIGRILTRFVPGEPGPHTVLVSVVRGSDRLTTIGPVLTITTLRSGFPGAFALANLLRSGAAPVAWLATVTFLVGLIRNLWRRRRPRREEHADLFAGS